MASSSSPYSFQGQTVVFPNTSTLQSLQRAVQSSQLSLHPRLHSIAADAAFLTSVLPLFPPFPRLANLHCGAWYLPPSPSSPHPSTCYFKSSDSHCYHWTFSLTRCNPHVIELCGRQGGVLIVDATRQGKRFPDSFSRTIPIWACVVNRAVARWRRQSGVTWPPDHQTGVGVEEEVEDVEEWDEELHTPEWVSDTEKAQILERIDDFVLIFMVSPPLTSRLRISHFSPNSLRSLPLPFPLLAECRLRPPSLRHSAHPPSPPPLAGPLHASSPLPC